MKVHQDPDHGFKLEVFLHGPAVPSSDWRQKLLISDDLEFLKPDDGDLAMFVNHGEIAVLTSGWLGELGDFGEAVREAVRVFVLRDVRFG